MARTHHDTLIRNLAVAESLGVSRTDIARRCARPRQLQKLPKLPGELDRSSFADHGEVLETWNAIAELQPASRLLQPLTTAMPLTTWRYLGHAARTAATVGAAVSIITQHFDYWTDSGRWSLDWEDPQFVRLTFERKATCEGGCLANQIILTSSVGVIWNLLGEVLRPAACKLQDVARGSRRETERLVEAKVELGAPHTSVVFPRAPFEARLPLADREIHREFLSLAQQYRLSRQGGHTAGVVADDWLVEFRRALSDRLEDQRLPMRAEVASELGCSESVLDAMLERRGRKFSEERLSLSMEKARELLRQQQLSVTQVAMRMGYGDHSSFTRAFQKAVGLSPRQYRLRVGGAQG